jgi:hypothetical protein
MIQGRFSSHQAPNSMELWWGHQNPQIKVSGEGLVSHRFRFDKQNLICLGNSMFVLGLWYLHRIQFFNFIILLAVATSNLRTMRPSTGKGLTSQSHTRRSLQCAFAHLFETYHLDWLGRCLPAHLFAGSRQRTSLDGLWMG